VTKTVLLAGLLGGVLGAALSFALSRWVTPAPHPPARDAGQSAAQPPAQASPEARHFADQIIARLQSGRDEEVIALMRPVFPELNDKEFAENVRTSFLAARAGKPYGPSIGFELTRETAVAPDVARFVYIERFAHGCFVWSVACYQGQQGWQLAGLRHLKLDAAFELLK
jgi:hypothetical protein